MLKPKAVDERLVLTINPETVLAALALAARIAYGAAVICWRGLRVTKFDPLKLGRTEISSQRSLPSNEVEAMGKDNAAVNKPLVIGREEEETLVST